MYSVLPRLHTHSTPALIRILKHKLAYLVYSIAFYLFPLIQDTTYPLSVPLLLMYTTHDSKAPSPYTPKSTSARILFPYLLCANINTDFFLSFACFSCGLSVARTGIAAQIIRRPITTYRILPCPFYVVSFCLVVFRSALCCRLNMLM